MKHRPITRAGLLVLALAAGVTTAVLPISGCRGPESPPQDLMAQEPLHAVRVQHPRVRAYVSAVQCVDGRCVQLGREAVDIETAEEAEVHTDAHTELDEADSQAAVKVRQRSPRPSRS